MAIKHYDVRLTDGTWESVPGIYIISPAGNVYSLESIVRNLLAHNKLEQFKVAGLEAKYNEDTNEIELIYPNI